MAIERNRTRAVRVGATMFGAGNPIAIQSMTATRTQDIDATVAQVQQLQQAGADIVRIAVDSQRDATALASIRAATDANLSVDLQENYRLAETVAPTVDKIRYNPGHLYHHESDKPWQDKVRYLVDVAGSHDCALRIGVNCGSVDPAKRAQFPPDDSIGPMLASATEHAALLDDCQFDQYCISLKDSDPQLVIQVNQAFAAQRPEVPLHLGVTEAGLPPDGILKTRWALMPLLRAGVGDTLRVSLTVPNDQKWREIEAARTILDDVASGRPVPPLPAAGLNIISCPSCARVENEAFVQLAQQVKELTRFAADVPITIAVMGCRVNGPGETDDADLGLWCGPTTVNLKRGGTTVGAFGYDEILDRLGDEVDRLVAARRDSVDD